MTSLGITFGASGAGSRRPPGLLDLRQFIDQNAPAYSTEKEAGYRRSLKKAREESEFDENKQTIFVPDDDEALTRMTTEEDVMQFDDAIEFDDEAAWESVPRSHRRGRFAQYRELARTRLAEAAQLGRTRSDQKILRLKSRFNEFKTQWDQERQTLEASLREAERETEDAKRKAELAVKKLEDLYERFKQTQSLSNADSSELQAHIGQLQVDKTQLETRVEELRHEVRVLNQLLKQAAKEKEEVEKRLAAAPTHETAVPAKQKSSTVASEADDIFADIPSEEASSGGDIPFPEDLLQDGGPGLHLADHPIVGEFMRTYQHIMRSKSRLSDLLSEHAAYKEVASNLSTMGDASLQLDRESRITPQIEDLGRNLTFVSDQIFLLVENVILSLENLRRQPPAAAATPATEQPMRRQESVEAAARLSKDKEDELMQQIEELKSKYLNVGRILQEKEQKFSSELADRDAEIRELQQSVSQLRTEVDRLRAEQQVDLQNSLMFTKLDAERNAKTLKRALASRRIGEAAYETVLEAMDEYSSVPARRLLALSLRLQHAQTMDRLQAAIEDAVEGGEVSPARAQQLMDRLRELEGRSGRRYGQIMDHLREELLRLARGLVDTFEDVGESCSIFLIKPVLSLRHRENLDQHLRWVMEQNKRTAARRIEEEELSRHRLRPRLSSSPRGAARLSPCPEEEQLSDRRLPGISGSGMKQDSSLSDVWNLHASTDMRALPPGFDRNLLNTPRLLEMDVNKILLGQNRISSSVDAGKDAGGGNLRYYVPLKRRSLDNFSSAMHEQGGPPPTTPALGKQNSSAAPLPPIKAKTQS